MTPRFCDPQPCSSRVLWSQILIPTLVGIKIPAVGDSGILCPIDWGLWDSVPTVLCFPGSLEETGPEEGTSSGEARKQILAATCSSSRVYYAAWVSHQTLPLGVGGRSTASERIWVTLAGGCLPQGVSILPGLPSGPA